MNEDEQRIAIAEACSRMHTKWWSISPEDGSRIVHLPDYLRDVNAMQDAERFLDHHEQAFYVSELFTILGIDQPVYEKEARPNDFYFRVCHADAAQRAKAFLKVKGKWK